MPDPDQAPKYPIPKPIRRSYEVMPGWSAREIRTAAQGLAVAAPLAGLVYVLGGGVFGTVFAFLAPTAVGVALAYPVSVMDGTRWPTGFVVPARIKSGPRPGSMPMGGRTDDPMNNAPSFMPL